MTDWGVYLVADPTFCRRHGIEHVVKAALRGGVGVVQLRDKEASDEELGALAQRLLPVLGSVRVPLLINDRVELVKSVGADGVHLGEHDMSVERAREVLGARAIIGRSIDSAGEVSGLRHLPLDYLAVGPIFATSTKPDLPPPGGIPLVQEVRRAWKGVLIAIGGITPRNARQVFAAGVDGVAVVGAICGAADPEAAARALRSCRSSLESPDALRDTTHDFSVR